MSLKGNNTLKVLYLIDSISKVKGSHIREGNESDRRMRVMKVIEGINELITELIDRMPIKRLENEDGG